MKKLILLAVVLAALVVFQVQPASAKCSYAGHRVWPPPGPLPSNAIFVLRGWARTHEAVEALKTGDTYLECAGERIDLEPTTIYRGEKELSKAQLEPVRPLPAGATCRFHVPDLERMGGFSPWVGGSRTPEEWTVALPEDLTPPEWTGSPQEGEKRYIAYGCGPEITLDFSFPVVDENPVMALAEVVPLGPGPATRFLVRPRHGLVAIGHTMCAGPFKLKPGAPYQIWLQAMDAAGNLSTTRHGPIQFTAPLPDFEEPDTP